MFNLYANDLALVIKYLDLGITLIDNKTIALLMFADDIVILTNTRMELQTMIKKVSDWCDCWQLLINTTFTNWYNI